MADLAEQPRLIRVTDDTTAEELLTSIGIINAELKKLSRRGRIGQECAAYVANHARLDALCVELAAKNAAS